MRSAWLLLLTFPLAAAAQLPRKEANDEAIMNRMAYVEGKVLVTNGAGPGEAAAKRRSLLLRRWGCENAVVGITSDADGKYSLGLYPGKYEILGALADRSGTPTLLPSPGKPHSFELAINQSLRFDVSLVPPEGGMPEDTPSQLNQHAARMAVLHGKVHILNHPQLGKTPANGQGVFLQKMDCERAVVMPRADINGDYSIELSAGRYRVFDRYGYVEGHTKDFLAPTQKRSFELKAGQTLQFDIDLVIPKDVTPESPAGIISD